MEELDGLYWFELFLFVHALCKCPVLPSKSVHQFMSHILLSAEMHNFPSGVAPFPGAETGTGGRIRDVQATGTGANVTASTVGYSVGALNIHGYELP